MASDEVGLRGESGYTPSELPNVAAIVSVSRTTCFVGASQKSETVRVLPCRYWRRSPPQEWPDAPHAQAPEHLAGGCPGASDSIQAVPRSSSWPVCRLSTRQFVLEQRPLRPSLRHRSSGRFVTMRQAVSQVGSPSNRRPGAMALPIVLERGICRAD